MKNRKVFEDAWTAVGARFQSGTIFSERSLQAALASELYKELESRRLRINMVVEPRWILTDRTCAPDIVLTTGNRITDIFELKCVPHSYAHFKKDLEKLATYAQEHRPLLCRIDPVTGKDREGPKISASTQLHFVAVANFDASAVWSEDGKNVAAAVPRDLHHALFHWYGRVPGKAGGDKTWKISKNLAQ